MVRPFASATPSVSIELGAAVSFALAAIVVLLGIIAWFLRREIKNNDAAHAELRADVKRLLAGDVPWVTSLNNRIDRLYDLMPGRRGRRTLTRHGDLMDCFLSLRAAAGDVVGATAGRSNPHRSSRLTVRGR